MDFPVREELSVYKVFKKFPKHGREMEMVRVRPQVIAFLLPQL